MQNKQIYKISWYLMSFNNIFPLSFIKKISLQFGSFQNKPCFKILTLLFYALLYVRSVINNCNYDYIVLFFSQYNNECTFYFYAIWIQWCKSRGMGVYIPPIIRAHFPQKIEFSPSKNYSHILNFLSQIILLARSEYYYVYLFLISNLVLHQPWVFIYDHHYYK